MNVEHVALTIRSPEEIGNFYKELLGAREIKNFVLEKDIAREIFGIDRETSVFQLQKDNLLLELFVMPESFDHGFNHLCISVKNRVALVEKAAENAYECIRIRRKGSLLIFIKDKSGNIFEIWESDDQ